VYIVHTRRQWRGWTSSSNKINDAFPPLRLYLYRRLVHFLLCSRFRRPCVYKQYRRGEFWRYFLVLFVEHARILRVIFVVFTGGGRRNYAVRSIIMFSVYGTTTHSVCRNQMNREINNRPRKYDARRKYFARFTVNYHRELL